MLVTPTRWSGPGSFDRESADVVMQLNDATYDAGVAGRFRSKSRPDHLRRIRRRWCGHFGAGAECGVRPDAALLVHLPLDGIS